MAAMSSMSSTECFIDAGLKLFSVVELWERRYDCVSIQCIIL